MLMPRPSEARRSPRRRTLAEVRGLDGAEFGSDAQVLDLSGDGAFVRSAFSALESLGARLKLEIELPTDPRPIPVLARVVRASSHGLGLRFEEVAARDRSRLRSYAGFYEMDDAMVRVQRALGDLLPGSLLPLGDEAEIALLFNSLEAHGVDVSVLVPGRGFAPRAAHLRVLKQGADAPRLELERIEGGPLDARAVYVAFRDGALYYAFEGLVERRAERTHLLLPERVYLTERRNAPRASLRDAYLELEAPFAPGGALRWPVLDLGSGGAAIQLDGSHALVRGMRLPACLLDDGRGKRTITGATVRHVGRNADGSLRAGLRFDDLDEASALPTRDVVADAVRRPIDQGFGTRLRRGFSMLRGALFNRLRPKGSNAAGGRARPAVEVVSYKCKQGERIAAIIDANFDTSDPDARADLAIVIAPAFLKRKEVFSLFARTLVDDLGREGVNVCVLRFDARHTVGESAMDPALVAEDQPYLRWRFADVGDDMEASLKYVQRRFKPKQRALVSVSLSAIAARQVVLRSKDAPVDLWIAPYGCPDAQDTLRNYLAGLDLFELYRQGGRSEPLLIHGRPMDPDILYGKTIEDGLAFLEDARRDLSRIQIPVTWILGSYDCWVTRSRVQALLDAPGGGDREVFDVPTGHVLKSGAEAIEVFKLASESIAKHLLGRDRPARDPDLGRFEAQNRAEWARVDRLEVASVSDFWKNHLFSGAEEGAVDGDGEGDYDILLEHPDYQAFLRRHVELLDARPGEAIADLGCGTGNLSVAMLDGFAPGEAPRSMLQVDVVPDAVACTERKLRRALSARSGPPVELRQQVADLDASRLAPIADFLDGRLYGVEELSPRVEGFDEATAVKLHRRYGKELHGILRGQPSDAARVQSLCPELTDAEVEVVLELSRAARLVRGTVEPADLRPGVAVARTTADLRLARLRMGASAPNGGLTLGAPGSLDRIGCSLVLPYLYDPLPLLQEVHRALRPGGLLVISSLRPNFDPSKLYADEAEILHRAEAEGDPTAGRKLNALRRFSSLVGKLIELEEDGRFRFYAPDEVVTMLRGIGFREVHAFDSMGSPPAAFIVRAVR